MIDIILFWELDGDIWDEKKVTFHCIFHKFSLSDVLVVKDSFFLSLSLSHPIIFYEEGKYPIFNKNLKFSNPHHSSMSQGWVSELQNQKIHCIFGLTSVCGCD